MALVRFRNISREYHGREVLKDVNFELFAGQKIGLIGPNGSGKTTLLRIICSLVPPTEGQVELAGTVRIGYVPQHVEFETEQTVFDYLMGEYQHYKALLREKEAAVARFDQSSARRSDHKGMKNLLHEYQQARDAYDRMGGDQFERRLQTMLDKFGLADRAEHKISQLSGGEQNVLSIAQALLAEPNLLLLDEPGNHLDYQGLAWLDDFLQRFRGAVLLVSHNRYLLDRVVDGILELEDGRVGYYAGNYSAYREIRRARLRSRQAEYKAYQQRLEHLEKLVQRFADIAQGHSHEQSWGKRLRARRSQLRREKAQAPQKPTPEPAKISPDFQTDPTRADIALQIRNYSKVFQVKAPAPGPLQLFDNIDWDIAGGQRWALIGPNGCGKTTLLRDIVAKGNWRNKIIRIGPSLRIGYCAQQQEVLDGENTVFEELVSLKDANKEMVLGILARFLFRDEEVHKKISHLSGGERNRLQLARLMLLKCNFLILDEPTNHLDIPTREAVEQALAQFEGTILVVSHDRYFLDKVVDHVAEVQKKRLRFYEGNFTSYWQSRKVRLEKTGALLARRQREAQQAKEEKQKPGGRAWRRRKARAAALRKARKATEKIEQQIHRTEQQKELLQQQIAQAFTVGDNERGTELAEKLEELAAEIESLYRQWEQADKEFYNVQRSPADGIGYDE
ncbi:MAG: hypothetical protein AMJ79_10445 [Phycisphaerae bacterium SM23_30]|nr:MAG: hypothetical protein AMJ79_10445 [Phycisphaerae bacterium SM23_30]